jgi:hypothetical protein
MSATAEQIGRLRRMVAEAGDEVYTDVALAAVIETYPLVDTGGYAPADTGWTATYDLPAAAAAVWAEKAAALAGDFDFSADGATFHRSQVYEQAAAQMRFWLARRSVRSLTMRPEPRYPLAEDQTP